MIRISSVVPKRSAIKIKTVHQLRYLATNAFVVPNHPNKSHLHPTHVLPSPALLTTQGYLDRANAYLLPVYARPEIVLSKNKGAYVWDVEGKRYLDFCAGIAVNSLGGGDSGVLKVLNEQASKILHTSNVYHNEWAGKLAELLVTLTQSEGGLGYPSSRNASAANTDSQPGAKVFFANSGTEAIEGALKIARRVGKEVWAAQNGKKWDNDGCTKIKIVCFENSFHGRSMGALSVTSNTKYQKPFKPLIPGVEVGRLNDLEALEKGLVGEDTCAVIVEPIQGEGGIHEASEEWLRALRKKCDEVGAVLIFDEIQCGVYRTGTLWAHSDLPTGCHPDVVTMAKPLANGYPIGAVMIRDSVGQVMTAGSHGTTFGGSPLACAVGHHVLSRLSSRDFVSHIRETSGYLEKRLSLLPQWFPEFFEGESSIRGRGMIRGLGFRDESLPGKVVQLARERGVFLLTAGKDAVRLVPPLIVGKTEVDLAMDVLESCLSTLESK